MRRAICLGALVATGVLSLAAARGQQQQGAKPILQIEKLKDNLYIIATGHTPGPGFAGGNTLVLAKAVAGIKNVDTVVGGHLQPATWKEFEEYQRFNQDVLTVVREAVKAGRTADDALASLSKLPAKYKGYEVQRAKNAVNAIYNEIKR